MAEKGVVETKDDKEGNKSKILWWCLAVILLILGILFGLGIGEYKNSHDENVRLGDELVSTKKTLDACQKIKVPRCDDEPKVVLRKAQKKVHRYAVPKPPAVKPKVEEKKFDPKDCGEGTEAMFNKVTGKPECRVVVAPAPAPVVAKVEAPKPEMKCGKPLIRKLNDDGSTECIALPAEVAQPAVANGCLPPDAQGRIFCRAQRTVVSQPVVPIFSGYGYDRHQGYQRPEPRYTNPQPYWIVPPQQRPDTGPGVTTLPPGPGVTTLPPPQHWIVPPQPRPSSGPGVTTLPPGPGVVTR